MSQITTHVLDTSLGKPGKGVPVVFERLAGDEWQEIVRSVTNDDGRVPGLIPAGQILEPGTYRMTFATETYFQANNLQGFYPYASVVFYVTDASHYHIPLLLSPFGYSTYRGS